MAQLAIHGGPPTRTAAWPRWPQWGEAEAQRVQEVLESGEWGGFNPLVREFELAWAARHQAKYCISANNGTLTLEAALRALGVGVGDEVIVPPYTFIATANAVRLVGATPVFVDIEADTYNLDMDRVEEAIGPKTKAIIPVHFAGLAVDMDRLLPLARHHGLAVVEDTAHAHGGTWRGQPLGTLGDIGSFSLQQSKNLTAGEGGILITNNAELAAKLWSYANQGRDPEGRWYEHGMLGSNLRMTGWQAAILLAQMTRFDEQLTRRQASARYLTSILEEIDGPAPMRWDIRCDNHAHHLYMMRYDATKFNGLTREAFVDALKAEGVPCSTGYYRPLYEQTPLAEPFSRMMPCPVADQACKVSIWLAQNILLADPAEMEDIGRAIVKIRDQSR